MPLDPQAQKLLDDVQRANIPPLQELTPEEARRQMLAGSALMGRPAHVDSIEDRSIPGPEGGEIPIRIYHPGGDGLPTVVYFHGGGWVIGSVKTHDGYCRALANTAAAIVVSVDYRLAPEHEQPAAAEDSYAATCWVSENLAALGGRADALLVAGDSAGGNLAAVVSLMARDRSGPSIAKQLLIYPITDHNVRSGSYEEFADGYYLTRDAMIWFWDLYCPQVEDRSNPYLSPLRADDLRGLPAAHVLIAECDPLASEGEAYAVKLREAGVDVTLSIYDGMIHGFIRRFDALDRAKDALDEVAAAIGQL